MSCGAADKPECLSAASCWQSWHNFIPCRKTTLCSSWIALMRIFSSPVLYRWHCTLSLPLQTRFFLYRLAVVINSFTGPTVDNCVEELGIEALAGKRHAFFSDAGHFCHSIFQIKRRPYVDIVQDREHTADENVTF